MLSFHRSVLYIDFYLFLLIKVCPQGRGRKIHHLTCDCTAVLLSFAPIISFCSSELFWKELDINCTWQAASGIRAGSCQKIHSYLLSNIQRYPLKVMKYCLGFLLLLCSRPAHLLIKAQFASTRLIVVLIWGRSQTTNQKSNKYFLFTKAKKLFVFPIVCLFSRINPNIKVILTTQLKA